MELQIKPHPFDTFPVAGFLIKGNSLHDWLKELQRMHISLAGTQLFPVPDTTANKLFGCLVLTHPLPQKELIGKNEWCQQVLPGLFIPEKTILSPASQTDELQQLLGNTHYIFHPATGLAELTETIDLTVHVHLPDPIPGEPIFPERGTYLPSVIKSFQIFATTPEETLKKLEENGFPKQESMDTKPLSLLEKSRLSFYKQLFGKTDQNNQTDVPTGQIKNSILAKLLSLFGNSDRMTDNMLQDMEELERRNQRHIDRLMEMLRNNPEEALKYAIPLDSDHSQRGNNFGELSWSARWSDFSLFGRSGNNSGLSGSVIAGNGFRDLETQYRKTAEQLIQEGNYEKAAFIYLRLLKDPRRAAETLEKGELYEEAAALYLLPANKAIEKAAGCYEKGKMYNQAIPLRIELQQFEHAGDLYRLTGNHKEARANYLLAAEQHLTAKRYVKAAEIYKTKLQDTTTAKQVLYDGWLNGFDPVNTFMEYLQLFPKSEEVLSEIQQAIRTKKDDPGKKEMLEIVKRQYTVQTDIKTELREIAYTIVSEIAYNNPSALAELRLFNPQNKEFVKDTMRYLNRKRTH